MNLIPLNPSPTPLSLRFCNFTTSFGPAATFMAFVPTAKTDATWPPPPSIVIDLVIGNVPNPPGSRTSISPPGAVFDMAPAKVLHGAARLQGLLSSPRPDTQVRVACACMMIDPANRIANNFKVMAFISENAPLSSMMSSSKPCLFGDIVKIWALTFHNRKQESGKYSKKLNGVAYAGVLQIKQRE